jgi:hypothetical protein
VTVIARLSAAVVDALAGPALQARLADLGPMIRAAGIKAD